MNGVRILKGGLHSARVVDKLFKEGKIRVRAKIANNDENWTEVDYDTWKNLSSDKKYEIQIKGANDPRSWNRIKDRKKTLFPEDWSDEMIAEAQKQIEGKLRDILIKEYKLPEYDPSAAGKYWKYVNVDAEGKPMPITTQIKVNGKTLKVEIGGRYDANGRLIIKLETFYPFK